MKRFKHGDIVYSFLKYGEFHARIYKCNKMIQSIILKNDYKNLFIIGKVVGYIPSNKFNLEVRDTLLFIDDKKVVIKEKFDYDIILLPEDKAFKSKEEALAANDIMDILE